MYIYIHIMYIYIHMIYYMYIYYICMHPLMIAFGNPGNQTWRAGKSLICPASHV